MDTKRNCIMNGILRGFNLNVKCSGFHPEGLGSGVSKNGDIPWSASDTCFDKAYGSFSFHKFKGRHTKWSVVTSKHF